MREDEQTGRPVATPPLPREIWVVAWASLAGQVLLLAERGSRSGETSLVLSVLLGALVVGYVSAGVVRARTVRLAIAWIVLMVTAIADLVGMLSADDPGEASLTAASLATTVVTIVALALFHRTEWFAWQRTKPAPGLGAPIGGLVAIAVLVGVLTGIVMPSDDGVQVRFSVASR